MSALRSGVADYLLSSRFDLWERVLLLLNLLPLETSLVNLGQDEARADVALRPLLTIA